MWHHKKNQILEIMGLNGVIPIAKNQPFSANWQEDISNVVLWWLPTKPSENFLAWTRPTTNPLSRMGSLIKMGGLFNVEEMMVSVLHKYLEYKVEKLKYELMVMQPRIKNKINLNFQLVNKPPQISPHKVLLLVIID